MRIGHTKSLSIAAALVAAALFCAGCSAFGGEPSSSSFTEADRASFTQAFGEGAATGGAAGTAVAGPIGGIVGALLLGAGAAAARGYARAQRQLGESEGRHTGWDEAVASAGVQSPGGGS